MNRATVWAAGVFVYGVGAYGMFYVDRLSKKELVAGVSDVKVQRELVGGSEDRYVAVAKDYDKSIGWDEKLMWIGWMREKAAGHCEGTVLETAAGTGRNTPFLMRNDKVRSLTMADSCGPMLEIAYQKWKQAAYASDVPFPVSFSLADFSSQSIPPSLQNTIESFDSVMDTFGMCSYRDPFVAIDNMWRMLKPGGKLILLEHGRSGGGSIWRDWLDMALDKTAVDHANRWGCWWNRDIAGFVEHDSRWFIERLERKHFGTLVFIVATKK